MHGFQFMRSKAPSLFLLWLEISFSDVKIYKLNVKTKMGLIILKKTHSLHLPEEYSDTKWRMVPEEVLN
jgi:hypothetical protein